MTPAALRRTLRLSLAALVWGWAVAAGAGPLGFVQVQAGRTGLDGASGVRVSPDGAHVYAVSNTDDALVGFVRDAGSGALTAMQTLFDGAGGVDGLSGASGVAISADGAHVYVTAELEHELSVFARDAGSGTLSFVERQANGVGGVDGLLGATAVAVSPDGAHVYATGGADHAVAVFSRDAGTGALTFVEVQFDDLGGVDGLRGASSVAVSADGAHVYVTGAIDGAVAVFSRDAGSGALTFVEAQFEGVGGVEGLLGAASVTLSADDAHVYTAGEFASAVSAFSRDAGTGALTFVGALFDQDSFTPTPGVDGILGITAVTLSADGAHLYAAGGLDDAVAVFSRDVGTGALTFVEALCDQAPASCPPTPGVDGLNGASAVAVSPDGAHVYVTGGVDDAVAVFSRDAMLGTLGFVEALFDGTNVDGLLGASGASVSPDGAHVYATAVSDDALVVFAREPGTGALSFVENAFDGVGGVDGLNGARGVGVSPDGAHVYVASEDDHAVAVFARDAGSGGVTFVEAHFDGVAGVDGLRGAQSVAVSPDGAHVYVAGDIDDALAVFSRDAGSGALTFVELQRDGVGGVDGLDGAQSVAVSPDGAHVYAASRFDDAVTVFSRDAGSGALTFVELERDGVGGVDGLNGAAGVAVSPDGIHVLAAGETDDALVIFSRDAGTGALTFVAARFDGVSGVDGLDGVRSVAMGGDGSRVFVAGRLDEAVAAFARDAGTGALTFEGAVFDDVGGAEGLVGVRAVAASPDGGHVYAASGLDDALVVLRGFDLATFPPCPPPTGCSDALLGGASTPGGVDVSFDDSGGGQFSADFLPVAFKDRSALAFLVDPAHFDFFLPSEPLQLWDLQYDGVFSGVVTLSFGYDETTLLGPEGALLVYHYLTPFGGCVPQVDCEWVVLPTVLLDTVANTLTVTADSLSPFVLGYPRVCADGLDNDMDGFIDTADNGCGSAAGASEEKDCSDGIDNDRDGLVDFDSDPGEGDPGCRNTEWRFEDPECDDDVDNDGDGKIDHDGGAQGGTPDPQCTTSTWKNREAGGNCGLGFELAVLLAGLAVARRRR